jgi:hypothetical protein
LLLDSTSITYSLDFIHDAVHFLQGKHASHCTTL